MTKLQKIYASKYTKIKSVKKYKKILQDIVTGYNNKISRTHGYAPINVTKKNSNKVWHKLYSYYFSIFFIFSNFRKDFVFKIFEG